MKKLEVKKQVISLFMIGMLVMTLFIPAFNKIKQTASKSIYGTFINSVDNTSDSNQTSGQSSLNLIEEEGEYTTVMYPEFEILPPILITITFSSPNLFFTEHFREVSGPPPWA